jgi:hypothetical protein
MSSTRRRLLELALAAVSAALAAATFVSPRWCEMFVRVDLDRGSGAVEWAATAALMVVAAATARSARKYHRQHTDRDI